MTNAVDVSKFQLRIKPPLVTILGCVRHHYSHGVGVSQNEIFATWPSFRCDVSNYGSEWIVIFTKSSKTDKSQPTSLVREERHGLDN
jgi:hypothetical protein